jgi:hypothetical protein
VSESWKTVAPAIVVMVADMAGYLERLALRAAV